MKKSRSSHENPFIIPSLSNYFHSSIKILEPYLIILILQMRKPRSERLSNLSRDSQDQKCESWKTSIVLNCFNAFLSSVNYRSSPSSAWFRLSLSSFLPRLRTVTPEIHHIAMLPCSRPEVSETTKCIVEGFTQTCPSITG